MSDIFADSACAPHGPARAPRGEPRRRLLCWRGVMRSRNSSRLFTFRYIVTYKERHIILNWRQGSPSRSSVMCICKKRDATCQRHGQRKGLRRLRAFSMPHTDTQCTDATAYVGVHVHVSCFPFHRPLHICRMCPPNKAAYGVSKVTRWCDDLTCAQPQAARDATWATAISICALPFTPTGARAQRYTHSCVHSQPPPASATSRVL